MSETIHQTPGSTPKVQRVQIEGGGASDGAIVDGVSSSIKATVKDYTNANPLTVVTVDTNGDYVSGSGGTQYTEDAAAAANPVGTALNLIRADALVGVTTTDGDNVAARGTDKGELYVKHADAIAVTNAGLTELAAAIDTEVQVDVVGALPAGNNNIGDVDVLSSALPTGAATSAKQDTQITALELIDDAVFVDDADWTDNTSKHINVGGVYQSVPHTVTDGDVTPFLTDANGRQIVAAIQSGTWDEVGINDSGNSITVDGTVAVTGVSTVAEQQTQTTHLATIAGDTTDIETAVELIDDTVATLGTTTYTETTSKGLVIGAVRRDANTSLVDTTNEVAPLQVNATGELKVAQIQALPAGTNAIGKLAANSGVDIGDVDVLTLPNVTLAAGTNTNEVVGDVAEDIPLAGNPVRMGMRASAAVPSAMSADGDVVTPWGDLRGRQVVTQKAGTATTSSVADSATNVTVLAANTARLGATVSNDSTTILYLKLGTTATTTDYTVKLNTDGYYEVPFGYTGIIDGIWSANASGSARVTEIT